MLRILQYEHIMHVLTDSLVAVGAFVAFVSFDVILGSIAAVFSMIYFFYRVKRLIIVNHNGSTKDFLKFFIKKIKKDGE